MEKKPFGLSSAVFAFALIISVILTVIGIVEYVRNSNYTPLLIGVVLIVGTLVGYGVSCQISSSLRQWSEKWERFSSLVDDRMQQFSVMMNMISEQQLISERAKAVAFRDKDREAMNRAIREELGRGEFDAALVLVNDFENTFGYKQEADQLRTEIAQMREAAIRRDVSEGIAQIERDTSAEKWDEALVLAEQLAAKYPGHEMTVNLPDQVRGRKESIKQQLLERWRDAVARKDTNASVDLLRALDIYVTPQEVAELKDGALEIFKARIEQLREHFKTSVHEKKWAEAQQVGQDIIQEFPTSKLAQEVRDMMDTLRAREAEEVPAATA